jgi:beta-1,2-mannobiose phosphorylase / 1,2-beta-oligomannan phosphorylase
MLLKRTETLLEPNGDPCEAEGLFNPASARTRDGKLLLYPRMVAQGNVSRIGLVNVDGPATAPEFTRIGYALEPQASYEVRSQHGGYGCEDPRVTFIPVLDAYVMAYVAYGPLGPRVAVAVSNDAYAWERLGLLAFAPGLPASDDKDAAFFPEPVISPAGIVSIACYHRPMSWTAPPVHPCAAAPAVLCVSPRERECIRIGYIPLDAVLHDRRNLLCVTESVLVLEPDLRWGRIKVGAGTAPIRIDDGWFSLYHAVDVILEGARYTGITYSVGAVVHDIDRPHIVRYRSAEPLLFPQTPSERHGIVNNVVFPTAIDAREVGAGTYDVYYGMADARIGRLELTAVSV